MADPAPDISPFHRGLRGARRGTVLLFVLGLITVMLVTAFGFLRNMQMACGTQQGQRRDELSRLAAEMGMQHAIAICLHEYAMPKEVRDGGVVSGGAVATRLDSPHRNVFNLVSPVKPAGWKQTPQTYDMPAGLPFLNLFSEWRGGRYNSGYGVSGFSTGYTMRPGYARWFEANRWNYAPGGLYDPSSYDNLDFSPSRAPSFLKSPLPIAGGVSTPFPVVDPYEAGKANLRPGTDPLHNPLDNPLFLDADCRPVDDASKARYRLRYAVSVSDMSSALWANTDMPWLDDSSDWAGGAAAKRRHRRQYREAIEAVGMQTLPSDSASQSKQLALQSVYLGYGPVTNNQFFTDGIPYDWATRNPNGFVGPDQPNQPMGYRGDQQPFGDRRRLHQVLGSPFMNAFDPVRADGSRQWLGSAIPSFTDLGFALSHNKSAWEYWGSYTSDGPKGNQLGRSDEIAQFMTTPFGKPYDVDGHPWAVNILTAPARVLAAMVTAYMPPESRRMRVTTETQSPHYRYSVTKSGVTTVYDGWGDRDNKHDDPDPMADYWRSNSWTVPLEANLSIPGPGIDVFTDAFQPQGLIPFKHPTPPNRNYFGSSAADRPFPTVGVQDNRSTADRYPGAAFFTNVGTEPKAHKMTRWASVGANPVQVTDDLAPDIPAPQGAYDSLGRHIVFYVGTPVPASHPNHRYVTANIQMYLDGKNYITDFAPASPFSGAGINCYQSLDGERSFIVYWGDGNPTPPVTRLKSITTPAPATTYRPIHVPEDFSIPPELRTMEPEQVTAVTKPETWRISRSSSGSSTAGNSYWNRLSLAFLHAVLVTQTANMAWADPQDARSRSSGMDQDIASSSNNEPSTSPATLYPTLPAPLNSTPPGGRFSSTPGRTGAITYNTNPTDMTRAGLTRKGPGSWNPQATDFDSLEKVDRQFLANLGESFDLPGGRTPADVRSAERPPRYLRNQTTQDSGSYPGSTTYLVRMHMNVAEYWVSNNIRTLLTPIDASAGGALTARSTDDQTGLTPRALWLLDEWNGGTPPTYAPEAGYTPGTTTGTTPTRLARARAKLMERMLNDWRMSFLGAAKSYSAAFRPKDFDGDGLVFCSGYLGGAATDADTGLSCFEPVAPAGGRDGPGAPGLSVFSVTGCLTFTRSHQYKIHVRGELVDNALNVPVSEHYLESALLIDPDNNIVRPNPSGAWTPPAGIEDSTLIMQHQIHNFYRGFLARGYP